VSERAQLLLSLADDELILGWRDSEWTGIAPTLEEDVAFSSIAQNEIGHARAVYELLTDDADALAFDRALDEYRCAPFVELRLLDWAHAIARRWLYETADEIRIAALMADDDAKVASLAAKINREEAYHRMHAEMWRDRLRDEPRFVDAVADLWPYAAGMLPADQREELAARTSLDPPSNSLLQGKERGAHTDELAELWDEMTMVRRSAPTGAQW
jgi:ring-1,2-phenylacetyl-CoA epoxidase subunit PaaC